MSRSADWTDANADDPGVTLIELWAYLSDALGYYADTIAREARLKSRRRRLATGLAVVALFVWWRRRD